jgi:hypothetical protein
MWLKEKFDILTNSTQKSITEGFDPVATVGNISSGIGTMVGTITGAVTESKKIAEKKTIDTTIEKSKEKEKVTESKLEDKNLIDLCGNIFDLCGNVFDINAIDRTLTDDIIYYTLQSLLYLTALLLAMFTVNQLIFEPPIYRVIIFIIICLLPVFFSIIGLLPLILYYMSIALYRIYIRSTREFKESGKKLSILPAVYALLPLTTYEGDNNFSKFIRYPFFYPENDILQARLERQLGDYENELKEGFYKWDDITKQFPKFTTLFNELHESYKENITPKRMPAEKLMPAKSQGEQLISNPSVSQEK